MAESFFSFLSFFTATCCCDHSRCCCSCCRQLLVIRTLDWSILCIFFHCSFFFFFFFSSALLFSIVPWRINLIEKAQKSRQLGVVFPWLQCCARCDNDHEKERNWKVARGKERLNLMVIFFFCSFSFAACCSLFFFNHFNNQMTASCRWLCACVPVW